MDIVYLSSLIIFSITFSLWALDYILGFFYETSQYSVIKILSNLLKLESPQDIIFLFVLSSYS